MGLVPDLTVVFDLNGERKTLRYKQLPFSVWSELKAALGFTPASLWTSVGDYDVEALGAIIWLERKQVERTLRWTQIRGELERDEVDFLLVDCLANGQSFLASAIASPANEDVTPDPTLASN